MMLSFLKIGHGMGWLMNNQALQAKFQSWMKRMLMGNKNKKQKFKASLDKLELEETKERSIIHYRVPSMTELQHYRAPLGMTEH